MKSCRSGFIWCSSRDGPWGSHHDAARASKCAISSGLTELGEEEGEEEKGLDGGRVENCVVRCAGVGPRGGGAGARPSSSGTASGLVLYNRAWQMDKDRAV